jgi:hypothetical protein
MLVPPPRLFNRQPHPLLWSVFLALSRQHPVLYLLIPSYLHILLPLLGDVDQIKGITDEILLDVSVEGSVCSETGGVVDLKEVWVEFVVYHHIKSQHFETHVIAEVVRVHVRD